MNGLNSGGYVGVGQQLGGARDAVRQQQPGQGLQEGHQGSQCPLAQVGPQGQHHLCCLCYTGGAMLLSCCYTVVAQNFKSSACLRSTHCRLCCFAAVPVAY